MGKGDIDTETAGDFWIRICCVAAGITILGDWQNSGLGCVIGAGVGVLVSWPIRMLLLHPELPETTASLTETPPVRPPVILPPL